MLASPANDIRLTRSGHSRRLDPFRRSRGRRRVQPLLAGLFQAPALLLDCYKTTVREFNC